MPVLAGVLAWLAAHDARRGRTEGSGAQDLERVEAPFGGSLLLLLAALVYALGSAGNVYTLSVAAFPLAVFAWVVRFGGLPTLRRQAWALVLFACMVPVPLPILDGMNPHLIEASGRAAVTMLRPLDASVTWIGSTLTYNGWEIIVAEACSGSGTFLMLAVFTVFLGGLFSLRPAIAILAVLLTPPITLVVNGLRIGISAVALDRFGPDAATGTPHEILGQVLAIAAAVGLAWTASRWSGPRTDREVAL